MITLHRLDPSQNMQRFYTVDIQPTLFGEWSLLRFWGRLDRPGGQSHFRTFPTLSAAQQARDGLLREKQRKGYAAAA